jgi:putative heme transporter
VSSSVADPVTPVLATENPVPATRLETPSPKTSNRRVRWQWVAFGILVTVFVIETALLGPYLIRAVGSLSDPDPGWLAAAIAAELVSMGAFARVQRRMLSAGGQRVSVCRMQALTYAANAVSVSFPGGTALSSGYLFRRFRAWGATVAAAGFTLVASGVLSTVAFALLAITSAVLAGSGVLSSVLLIGGVLVLGAGVLLLRRRDRSEVVVRVAGRALDRANRLLHRAPDTGLATLLRFAQDLTAIKPRSRDWLVGLGFAGVNWIGDLACLLACCYAIGAHGTGLVLVMVAYVAGMSTSGISLLPGGFGVVDAAMIFALTRGGVPTVPATASVLLYRLVSFALIVALGWLVWTTAWFLDRHRARSIAFRLGYQPAVVAGAGAGAAQDIPD